MARDIRNMAADFARHGKELRKYIRTDAPRIIGKMGVDHFKENFDKEGFVNNGLQPWPKRKADNTSKKILTGETKELQDSIDYNADIGKTSWGTDVVYGSIHNRGGKTKAHTISPRRKRALKFKGKWGVGIWKKIKHPGSKIPKRQFIGHSEEFINKIDIRVGADITSILDR